MLTYEESIKLVSVMDKMAGTLEIHTKHITALEERVADLEMHLLHYLRSTKYHGLSGRQEVMRSIIEILEMREREAAKR